MANTGSMMSHARKIRAEYTSMNASSGINPCLIRLPTHSYELSMFSQGLFSRGNCAWRICSLNSGLEMFVENLLCAVEAFVKDRILDTTEHVEQAGELIVRPKMPQLNERGDRRNADHYERSD